jgi:hypothetical protein
VTGKNGAAAGSCPRAPATDPVLFLDRLHFAPVATLEVEVAAEQTFVCLVATLDRY